MKRFIAIIMIIAFMAADVSLSEEMQMKAGAVIASEDSAVHECLPNNTLDGRIESPNDIRIIAPTPAPYSAMSSIKDIFKNMQTVTPNPEYAAFEEWFKGNAATATPKPTESMSISDLFKSKVNTPTPKPTSTGGIIARYNEAISSKVLETSLKRGSKGEDVKKLQNRLIELNYLAAGEADGIYGAVTAKALHNFKKVNGIFDNCTGADQCDYDRGDGCTLFTSFAKKNTGDPLKSPKSSSSGSKKSGSSSSKKKSGSKKSSKKCSGCKGSRRCRYCNGLGHRPNMYNGNMGSCGACYGTGTCSRCWGSGRG